jgi:hypothetical protein
MGDYPGTPIIEGVGFWIGAIGYACLGTVNVPPDRRPPAGHSHGSERHRCASGVAANACFLVRHPARHDLRLFSQHKAPLRLGTGRRARFALSCLLKEDPP